MNLKNKINTVVYNMDLKMMIMYNYYVLYYVGVLLFTFSFFCKLLFNYDSKGLIYHYYHLHMYIYSKCKIYYNYKSQKVDINVTHKINKVTKI